MSCSTTLAGRGRLPVWVVRILVVLRRMVILSQIAVTCFDRFGHVTGAFLSFVIAGLDPAIHDEVQRVQP